MDHWPSLPPDPSTVLRTTEDVDAVTDRLRGLVLSFNTLRNTLIPISRLHPELLLEIFHVLVEQHDVGRPAMATSEVSDHYKWIRVTHICRAWRDIALRCPTLWTRIAVRHRDAERSFLERADDCALTFWTGLSSLSTSVLLDYGHRLLAAGTIYVRDDERSLIQSSCAGGVLQLPLLRSLYISTFLDVTKIQELSGAVMPKIRLLNLDCPWSLAKALLRPTLTHLEIHKDITSRLNCVSVQEWLEVLQGLPILEELHISNAIHLEGAHPATHTPSSVIDLPKLRKISLRQDRGWVNAVACAHLLVHLSYPWTAETEIEGSQPGHGFEDSHAIISHIATRMATSLLSPSAISPMPFRHLSVSSRPSYGGEAGVGLTLTRGALATRAQGTLSIVLSLTYPFGGPLWRDEHVVDDLLCHLSSTSLMAGISHLHLAELSSVSTPAGHAEVWTHLMQSPCAQLESVTLSSSAQMGAFMCALRQSLESRSDFLVQLQILSTSPSVIHPLNLLSPNLGYRSQGQHLIDLLWQRRERGLGPTRFNIGQDYSEEVDDIEVFEGYDEDHYTKRKRTRLVTGLAW